MNSALQIRLIVFLYNGLDCYFVDFVFFTWIVIVLEQPKLSRKIPFSKEVSKDNTIGGISSSPDLIVTKILRVLRTCLDFERELIL